MLENRNQAISDNFSAKFHKAREAFTAIRIFSGILIWRLRRPALEEGEKGLVTKGIRELTALLQRVRNGELKITLPSHL